MPYITKGTRVRVHRSTTRTSGFSLSGTQMKCLVQIENFDGIVTHTYGDNPDTPTIIQLVIRRDDGTEVEVDQADIVAVIQGELLPS